MTSQDARADTNLAALAAEAGQGEQASDLIAGVFRTRLEPADRQPEGAPAWRRLTVTDRTRADIARLGGQVDRERPAGAWPPGRTGRPGWGTPPTPTPPRPGSSSGQTLLAAGQPVPARRHLEEAAETRRGRFLPTSYRVQEDLLWLVRTALVLGHPRTVLDLLAEQAARDRLVR